MQDMVEAARMANSVKRPWANLFSSRYRCCNCCSCLATMLQSCALLARD